MLAVHRPAQTRIVAGVCAGLAARFGLDATLVRLSFLLLAMASGLGLVLYAIAWSLTPSEGSEVAPWRVLVQRRGEGSFVAPARDWFERTRDIWARRARSAWPRPLSRRWIGIGLMSLGATFVLHRAGLFGWLGVTGSLGLIAVAIGAGTLISLSTDDRPGERS